MRTFWFQRLHRRIILKYFGSTKNFLFWTVAIVVTVYFIDQYVINAETSPSDGNNGSTVVKKSENNLLEQEQLQNEEAKKPKSCNSQPECPAGQYSYYIKSGFDREGQPTICFNGYTVFDEQKKEGGRGINMLVVNEKTGRVVEKRTFDTYEDDKVLQRYFKLGVEGNPVILLATSDDASQSLTEDSRKLVESFGSQAIRKLGFRDSLVFIGQVGLLPPKFGIEKHNPKSDKSFADVAEISGCLSIPMGTLSPPEKKTTEEKKVADNVAPVAMEVQLGEVLENCGMTEKCPEDSVPVLISSGKENSVLPQICYNGKQIVSSSDKSQTMGRGMNVLSVDPVHKQPVKFVRFDTYESEKGSTDLIEFIKTLNPNHMLLVVAHDEAKTSLTADAVAALESVGSSFVSGLSFRDVWLLVGQPKLSGFSKFEEIEFGAHDQWPTPVNKKFCLPKTLPTLAQKQDLDAKKNAPNRVFCRKYDGYEELCRAENIDKVITPTPLGDTPMKDSAIFKVPIVLVPGLGHVSTYKQVTALFAIPGIDAKMITIMYDQKFQESGALADRFNIPKVELSSSTKYVYLVEKAMEEVWKKYPSAEHVILLEEEVIPSKDFLYFMSQCLSIISKDDSLIGVSAWNENGYSHSSGLPDLIYRGRMAPGLGIMLKKSFYTSHMQGKFSSCCSKRSWYGWFGEGGIDLGDKEMLYPDLSRVQRLPYVGLTETPDLINAYFTRPRAFSKGEMTALTNVDSFKSASAYDDAISSLIKEAVKVDATVDCASLGNFTFIPSGTKSKTFVVLAEQVDAKDEDTLGKKTGCFELFTAPGYKLRGVHNSVLRFSHEGNTVLIVGTKSQQYKTK